MALTSQGQRIAKTEPADAFGKLYLTPEEMVAVPQVDAAMRRDLAALYDYDSMDTVGPL